jgi:hypothetical protein
MQTCSPLGQPGTSSFSFNVPSWSTEYVCGQCGVQPWFECCHSSCMIPLHKNVFHTLKQLRAHARHWHAQLASPEENILVLNTVCHTNDSDSNCSYTDEFDGVQQLEDVSVVDAFLTFAFVKTGTAQFSDWCIAGSVTQATRCLVLQSLLQAPTTLYPETLSKLPPHSIHLFLHIAFMLMTTGQTQHDALSNILVLVFSLILPDYKEWPTMPSTIAGFQSHILNPTNQHSLVSILPIPSVYMLHDQSHAYCCLRDIAAYVLLLPRSTGAPPVPLRLTQLCQNAVMQKILLTAPPSRTTKCLVSLGLIFWLDGWDPSASSKNNRSPIHTASVTVLCIDNLTGVLFNAPTFPFPCGPGKADHNIIFQALRHSLEKVQSSEDIVWSDHHRCYHAMENNRPILSPSTLDQHKPTSRVEDIPVVNAYRMAL